MRQTASYDAVVIGSGPNGLAAAITLARAGRSVCVLEAEDLPGGCVKSDEGTLPGFIHDTCSAIFPLTVGTPFFSSIPMDALPVEWIQPPAALAHPFDDGSCILVSSSLERTAGSLGADGQAYVRFAGLFARRWGDLAADVLLPPVHVPRHPLLFALFGLRGVWPVSLLAKALFRTPRGQALLAGMGAHSIMPLEHPLTGSFALLMCASAHATGWPIPRGGAGSLSRALAGYAADLGVEIRTSSRVYGLDDLAGPHLLLDLTPRQVLSIARDRIPAGLRRRLGRYRYGPGVFKVDWALDGPIPWKASGCLDAATLHLGGTYGEIALSERQVARGIHPERPFVICTQPSLFDSTRAPDGKHTAWAYCHVPNGSAFDMTERIEGQVERFAPGFRKRILARRALGPQALELLNANLVGGDIAGGANGIVQLLFRPVASFDPYRLSYRLSLCSSSTPPGGGVHGMCGFNAARRIIRD